MQRFNLERDKYAYKKNRLVEYKNIIMYKSNYINIRNFTNYVEKKFDKDIWTEAFRKALHESHYVYIPKGKYYIDGCIVLSSKSKIKAHKKAEICLTKETKTVMIRNADVIDGSKQLISDEQPITCDIHIEGGVWSTEYDKRAEYGKICIFDEKDSMHGVHALMLFSGVKNLHLKNLVFKNTPAFSVQLGRIDNFIIEKIKFIDCYADGIHVNGGTKNGVIRNICGQAGDDLVALNAYDWPTSTINQGPIENVVIYNVNSQGKSFNLMRIQPGKTSVKNGNIDCYIKNIIIDNIKGVETYKMYFQTPEYVGEPEGSFVGDIENVLIKNLKIFKTRPSDGTPNYVNADPITGHFGVFELGSNINGLTLQNIKVKFKCENKYKNLEHFIVVGPKSCYFEKENLEVFDPYVISQVKNLRYKNIKINGKKVENIMEHVKEIKFEKLYDSEYASGYGEIENTIKL